MLVACNQTDKFKLISNKSYGCSVQPLWDSNFEYSVSSIVYVCVYWFLFCCCCVLLKLLLFSLVVWDLVNDKFITYVGQIYIDFILCMEEAKALQNLSNKLHFIKPMKIFIFLSGQNFFSQTCQNLYTFTCICERFCGCLYACVRACEWFCVCILHKNVC